MAVSAVLVLVLAATVAMGDQRELRVAVTSPAEGDSVAVTTRSVAITFARDPDRAAVEKNFYLEPPVLGSFVWRGRTAEYVFVHTLDAGPVTVRILPGHLGAGGEMLRQQFKLTFQARPPGYATIVNDPAKGDSLVVVTDGGPARTLLTAPSVRDIAVAHDGSSIAVVTAAAPEGRGGLQLVNPRTGAVGRLGDSTAINVGGVAWAADSTSLFVVRRDVLPDGSESVPRIWLMRPSGEFLYPVDQSGAPSTAPAPAPNGQSVAFISPASGELSVLTLLGAEPKAVGHPRGGTPAWDPNSQLVVFESVPPTGEGTIPLQAVQVRSVDGSVDRTFGRIGEVRSDPRFRDDDTVMSLRRVIGPESKGTDLLFESVTSGQLLRAIQLTPQLDSVLSWDIDPTHQRIVYAAGSEQSVQDIEIDLESGKRTPLPASGRLVRFVP